MLKVLRMDSSHHKGGILCLLKDNNLESSDAGSGTCKLDYENPIIVTYWKAQIPSLIPHGISSKSLLLSAPFLQLLNGEMIITSEWASSEYLTMKCFISCKSELKKNTSGILIFNITFVLTQNYTFSLRIQI